MCTRVLGDSWPVQHCWFWRSLWLHAAISLGRGRACIGAPSHASACTLLGALRHHAPGIWCTTHTAADVQPAMSSAPRVHQSCPVGQLAALVTTQPDVQVCCRAGPVFKQLPCRQETGAACLETLLPCWGFVLG